MKCEKKHLYMYFMYEMMFISYMYVIYLSATSTLMGQKYFLTKIFPYIFHIKPLIFLTFSWSHSLAIFMKFSPLIVELLEFILISSCNFFELFSSPGPKVHVNYCHHLASVVCHLSSVNFSHFKLLLRNHWADWNQT